MKYSEFHRMIRRNGWVFVSATGSHYFYEKDGVLSPPVPYHGAKEMGEGLRKSLIRVMGLE
ncbi:type II toxin-antitoxin system HicA family toxin [Bacteroides sp. OttesenSCG-928-D19]|nr:type II toxin-antitoxin system HicA family toxin [Bacteroides sp. OttesenSCG-928-D19]